MADVAIITPDEIFIANYGDSSLTQILSRSLGSLFRCALDLLTNKAPPQYGNDGGGGVGVPEFEPSSICLAKMFKMRRLLQREQQQQVRQRIRHLQGLC